DDDGGGGGVMVASVGRQSEERDGAWRRVPMRIGYIHRRGGMLELAGKIPSEFMEGREL
ncbi:hypothetical protein Tco_0470190, partial [Tanacetum coccineum]